MKPSLPSKIGERGPWFLSSDEIYEVPMKKPMSANGMAKMVCENLISDK
jgi:hypothetical protein